jgi:hypothetical protein
MIDSLLENIGTDIWTDRCGSTGDDAQKDPRCRPVILSSHQPSFCSLAAFIAVNHGI